MNFRFQLAGLLAALSMSTSVFAGDIQVENAWARTTAPGQDTGMVDLAISSKQTATLVGVSSPVAKSVELHYMAHENGVMKMREVKSISLPAGKRVELGESGHHLMLIGLKAPFKTGDIVPLTLEVELGDKRKVMFDANAEVRPMGKRTQEHHHRH